jgi:hypothetical protein
MLDINAYLTAARKLAALAAVMNLDDTRLAILDADGQLLIQGGPGSGKTTIALLKAARTLVRLEPEQQVVFLSFSRAAVRQIATMSPSTFPAPCVTARRSARSRVLHGPRPRARAAAKRSPGRVPAARRGKPPQGRPRRGARADAALPGWYPLRYCRSDVYGCLDC